MFGQVVVDDQRLPALFHELFAHGAAGVRRDVLQGGRLRRRSDDDDGVIHGPMLFQDGYHLGDLGQLLADGDIDADQVLALLVDDRVDRQGRLARLPVADDQLTLPAADREHGVDGLDAGLHRGVHALAHHHVGCDPLDGPVLGRGDRAFAVDRLAQSIDHPADQPVAHRHRHDAPGAAHQVALLDAGIVAHDDDADIVGFQVKGQAHDALAARLGRELDQLHGHDVGQAAGAGDAVSHLEHRSDVHRLDRGLKGFDLLFQCCRDFFGS